VTAASTDNLVTAKYDAATNTWNDAAIADLPAAPAPHWGAANAVYNGKWFVGPGASGGAIQSTAIQWDPSTNLWTNSPNAPLARYRAAGAALGASFYAIGGNPFVGTTDNQKLTCPTGGGSPTPTATATATGTPTATATATATVAPTATATATATVAPTATATATATATSTATATIAPTATPSTTPVQVQAINLSTRMRVQTGANVGIGGFIVTGSAPKRVILRAIGPSLVGFGIPIGNVLADPVLELHGPGAFVTITNNNWRDTQEAEIQATGVPPTNDFESAIVVTLTPGSYTAIVRGNNGTSGVALVEVYDLNQASASKLANLSTRAFVSTGSDIMIAGFLLSGNTLVDRVVVRGIGPSLAPGLFPASAVLANPVLELRDSNGTLLVANNDWQDNAAQAAELIADGLAPSSPLESGIAATLPPGLYTALLAGLNNGTGIGLVEVYDLGP